MAGLPAAAGGRGRGGRRRGGGAALFGDEREQFVARDAEAGGGRLEDLDILLGLANNLGIMPGTTICGLADGAAWPIKNALTKFRGEIEEYIRTHQERRGLVTPLQEAVAHGISPGPFDSSMPPATAALAGPDSAPSRGPLH